MTIIAIDGVSATGKGTLAQRLAQHFNFAFLDTGALYRTVGYRMHHMGLDIHNENQAVHMVNTLPMQDITVLQASPSIRTEEVGGFASVVAAMPRVRQALLDVQRQFATHPVDADGTPLKGAVLDGRDIGTVICPDADFKLFLTADTKIRAERRLKELQSRGKNVILQDVLEEMKERDKRDIARKVAPTVPAKDAYILDTTSLTPDEVFAQALAFIEQEQKSPR